MTTSSKVAIGAVVVLGIAAIAYFTVWKPTSGSSTEQAANTAITEETVSASTVANPIASIMAAAGQVVGNPTAILEGPIGFSASFVEHLA